MKSKLDHIENQLKRVFESSDLVFPWKGDHLSIVKKLLDVMNDSIVEIKPENQTIPSIFTIRVPEKDYPSINFKDETLKLLAQTLEEAANEVGVQFRTKPVIRMEITSIPGIDEIQIITSQQIRLGEKTTAITTENSEKVLSSQLSPPDAFLIVNDRENFTLNQPVISIGRRNDNQLIIDDPHVSRLHAQIRLIKNHFVLFDLDATGGTFVNGHQISRHILQPGDVISLASAPIIYGEETHPEEDTPFENNINSTAKTP